MNAEPTETMGGEHAGGHRWRAYDGLRACWPDERGEHGRHEHFAVLESGSWFAMMPFGQKFALLLGRIEPSFLIP